MKKAHAALVAASSAARAGAIAAPALARNQALPTPSSFPVERGNLTLH